MDERRDEAGDQPPDEDMAPNPGKPGPAADADPVTQADAGLPGGSGAIPEQATVNPASPHEVEEGVERPDDQGSD